MSIANDRDGRRSSDLPTVNSIWHVRAAPGGFYRSLPVKVVANVLAIWAVSSYAGMVLLPMYAPEKWELPLSVSPNVVVDGEGQIYCGTQAYGQIQVYDMHGVFLRRWGISGGGPRRLELTSAGLLRVHELRGGRIAVYERDGTMVTREMASPTAIAVAGRPRAQGDPRYEMRGSILLPGHVVRVGENGVEVDVIPARMYWFPFQAPFPTFFFFWIGVAVVYLGRVC